MQLRTIALLSVLAPSFGCVIEHHHDDDPRRPSRNDYLKSDVLVFGLDPALGEGSQAWFDGTCAWVDSYCVPVDVYGTSCASEDVPMDVVLVGNDVAAVLCYPVGDPIYSVYPGYGSIVVPSFDHGASVEFTQSSEGAPVLGDLVINADDVVVFGRGPGATLIDGDVFVRGDRVQLRGLTIMGGLSLEGAAPTLSYSDIWSDVDVLGHDAILAGNLVFGDLYALGSAPLLVDNGVQGLFSTDFDASCGGNYAFYDANNNGVVTAAEVTSDAYCE